VLSCDEFLAEFGDYLNDEASLELRTLLEEHLRECKTCRVVVDSTRKTVRVVTDTGSFDLPDDAFEPIIAQVMSRIRDRSSNSG
jgi:predicted anti-sigma-YlaC factor YlaD